MKIHNRYKFIVLALTIVSFAGCSKYLDVNPDMRTELNTVEKVGQLLVAAYPEHDHFLFTEAASDNSVDKGPGVGNINETAMDSYFWKEVMTATGNNVPNTYWNSAYSAIASANEAIEAIESNDFGVKGQQYKGEALLARAYAHFMLVNIFAKSYQINGSNSSAGIPYVKESEKEVFKQYERGTVESVYKDIEVDLIEGMKLIQGLTFKSPKFHFNPQAAHAFAARFYLFKGEWDRVIEHVSAIYPDNNFKANLRPIGTTLRTFEFANAPLEFMNSQRNYNLMLANVFSSFASVIGNGRYGFGLAGQALFNSTSVTGKALYQRYGSYGDDKLTTNKYPNLFFVTNALSNIGYNYTIVSLFSLDEALINRAEAYVHLSKYDLALKDLNVFAEVRTQDYKSGEHIITEQKVLSFYETDDLKEGLIETVLDFRQRAFVHEGLRWFDINRYGLEIEHNHIATDGLETFDVLKKDDPRRVFQLPESVRTSGIESNPR